MKAVVLRIEGALQDHLRRRRFLQQDIFVALSLFDSELLYELALQLSVTFLI